MKPIFYFELGNLNIQIPSYFLFSVLGILTGTILLGIKLYKRSLLNIITGILIITFIPVLLIGSRILYYFHQPEQFNGLTSVFQNFFPYGFSIYGGIILVIAYSYLVLIKTDISLRMFWDNAVAPFAIGLSIGRIGCLLGGCCFGKETSMPWGIKFPYLSLAHKYQIIQSDINMFSCPKPVHPTQIYEFTALILIAYISHFFEKRNIKRGEISLIGIGLYSLFRLINYYFRADPSGNLPEIFYPLLYMTIIIAVLKGIFQLNTNKENQ